MRGAMGNSARAGVVAAATLASALAGCRGADGPAAGGAGGDDLRRDLDAAAASAAFAPPLRGDAPVRFVSALELGASLATSGTARAAAPAHPRQAAPVRGRQNAATRVIVRVRYVDAAPSAPVAPATVEEVASIDAPATGASAMGGGGTFSSGAEVGPGPSAQSSTQVGASTRGPARRGAGWGIVGGILGVVIRGGAVGGVDMFDIDHPRGGSGTRVLPPLPGRRPRPGGMITGTLHGELGGRPSGTVVVPLGALLGAVPRTRE